LENAVIGMIKFVFSSWVEGFTHPAGTTILTVPMDFIYGSHSVLECLKAGNRSVERILVADGAAGRSIQEILQLARQRGIPFKYEPRAALDRQSAGAVHQGVIALCAARAYSDLEELLENAGQEGLLVVLDSIEDPRNLGAILRSCAAFGVHGVILPKDRAAGLSPVTAKTAEGALEYLKVARVTNLVRALEQLKEGGFWVVGIESGQEKSCAEVDLTRPIALVFGSEGGGIRRLLRENCDLLASIPARGAIHSLNVSVAAGIALYEVARQRQQKTPAI
jgi:23S rRNA (guanosine2251-2'-O)-methyltransferase